MIYVRNVGNEPTLAFTLDAVYEALPKYEVATGFVEHLQQGPSGIPRDHFRLNPLRHSAITLLLTSHFSTPTFPFGRSPIGAY